MSVKKTQPAKRINLGPASAKGTQSEETDSERRTVSVEEASRILGISRGAAYTHARDGSIPTIRLGKRLLVPKAALDKLLTVA
jgi:excisionase family DNA binding protein